MPHNSGRNRRRNFSGGGENTRRKQLCKCCYRQFHHTCSCCSKQFIKNLNKPTCDDCTGGTRRNLLCRCGYKITRSNKKALDTTATIHAKVCPTMASHLPVILATPWADFQYGNDPRVAWHDNGIIRLALEGDEQPAPAVVVPDNYLPGDGIIERRVAEGANMPFRPRREFTEEEHQEIRREIQERVDRIRGRTFYLITILFYL